MKKRKKGSGGARPGAGRKKLPPEKVKRLISVRLSEEDVARDFGAEILKNTILRRKSKNQE